MLVVELAGLLTVPGAARRADVAESVIRRAVAAGKLPAVRRWKRVLIRAEDLQRFVAQHAGL